MQWEYTVLVQMWDDSEREWYWLDAEENERRGVKERLNQLGRESWELVGINNLADNQVQYFLKRPI